MPDPERKAAFRARVAEWAKKLDVHVAGVYVRPMRTKWASCSSNGILSFNTELLELDPQVWNYVIVHELLHFEVPNHGKLWKSLMRAHVGDWERAARRSSAIMRNGSVGRCETVARGRSKRRRRASGL